MIYDFRVWETFVYKLNANKNTTTTIREKTFTKEKKIK